MKYLNLNFWSFDFNLFRDWKQKSPGVGWRVSHFDFSVYDCLRSWPWEFKNEFLTDNVQNDNASLFKNFKFRTY